LEREVGEDEVIVPDGACLRASVFADVSVHELHGLGPLAAVGTANGLGRFDEGDVDVARPFSVACELVHGGYHCGIGSVGHDHEMTSTLLGELPDLLKDRWKVFCAPMYS
jgi:hypothetical protein